MHLFFIMESTMPRTRHDSNKINITPSLLACKTVTLGEPTAWYICRCLTFRSLQANVWPWMTFKVKFITITAVCCGLMAWHQVWVFQGRTFTRHQASISINQEQLEDKQTVGSHGQSFTVHISFFAHNSSELKYDFSWLAKMILFRELKTWSCKSFIGTVITTTHKPHMLCADLTLIITTVLFGHENCIKISISDKEIKYHTEICMCIVEYLILHLKQVTYIKKKFWKPVGVVVNFTRYI